jgi:hypothetical protein
VVWWLFRLGSGLRLGFAALGIEAPKREVCSGPTAGTFVWGLEDGFR